MLYYVGCLPSSDERASRIAMSIITILNAANIDFGVLGEEEKCCINEILRIGERGLFDELGIGQRWRSRGFVLRTKLLKLLSIIVTS